LYGKSVAPGSDFIFARMEQDELSNKTLSFIKERSV